MLQEGAGSDLVIDGQQLLIIPQSSMEMNGLSVISVLSACVLSSFRFVGLLLGPLLNNVLL